MHHVQLTDPAPLSNLSQQVPSSIPTEHLCALAVCCSLMPNTAFNFKWDSAKESFVTLGIDLTFLSLGFCFCNRGTVLPTLQDYCKGQTQWLRAVLCVPWGDLCS